MKKIVALDIDGVLNSQDHSIACSALGIRVPKEQRLDTVNVGLLKKLCDVTGAHVLITSSWRLRNTADDFRRIFAHFGWSDFPYVGMTAVARSYPEGQRRGQEIATWLDAYNVTDYVILDDDSDMMPHQYSRFVHVSGINGFSSKHLCAALRILGCPNVLLEQVTHFQRKVTYGEVTVPSSQEL